MPFTEFWYDKGENRRKHNGTSSQAEIVYEHGHWVGKCPRGFSLDIAQSLIEDAIPEYRPRQQDSPFRLWNYYDGAVYAARTSDGGTTWHGYPQCDPPRNVLRELEKRADVQGQKGELKKWLIQKH